MGKKWFHQILLILFLLTSISYAGKYTIEGYIYDGDTGFGVPGVEIFLTDTSIGTLSDQNGLYRLSSMSKENELVIRHIKYHNINRTVTFEEKHHIRKNFYIFPSTLAMDSITVWGNPFFPGRNTKDFNKIESRFYSERFQQYLQMLKKGNWTWIELVSYSMWLITDDEYFNKLWTLKSRSEREQFIDIFYKQNDPTPGTKRNEFKEEFERRIRYNWTHFSEMDSSGISKNSRKEESAKKKKGFFSKVVSSSKRQSEDRLRSWSKRAPWDARGEIYFKYGEPTTRRGSTADMATISSSDQWMDSTVDDDMEYWYYRELDLDFDILSHYTNIYKKAIIPGEMSSRRILAQSNSSDSELMVNRDLFYSEYIDKKIFYYNPKEEKKPLDSVELSVIVPKNNTEKTIVDLSLYPEYFKSLVSQNYYSIISIDFIIKDINNPMLKMKKKVAHLRTIKNSPEAKLSYPLSVMLNKGQYEIEVIVEDHNSYCLGNKVMIFSIE